MDVICKEIDFCLSFYYIESLLSVHIYCLWADFLHLFLNHMQCVNMYVSQDASTALIMSLQENSTGGVMHFVQTPLSFALSVTSVAFDHNITVSWDIPTDEATHQDWIGRCRTNHMPHDVVHMYVT